MRTSLPCASGLGADMELGSAVVGYDLMDRLEIRTRRHCGKHLADRRLSFSNVRVFQPFRQFLSALGEISFQGKVLALNGNELFLRALEENISLLSHLILVVPVQDKCG